VQDFYLQGGTVSMNSSSKTVKQSDKDFERTLDLLEKKYFHNGGDPDAEVIINWNKREAKEDGCISIYATNSTVSSAIKRCRSGIRAVRYNRDGVELLVDVSFVRPMHTILKIRP
jgi:hypothetical protein